MSVSVGTSDNLRQNFRQPEVPTQRAGSSDSYVNYEICDNMNFENEIAYNPTS